MKIKILAIVVLLLISSNSIFAQDSKMTFKKFDDIQLDGKNQIYLDLKDKLIYNKHRFTYKDSIQDEPKVKSENPLKKSPFLGGLFSAIIPGSGQFYAKRYLKSAIFLAVEAGLWITYGIFNKKGNDQTDYYQNYANANWDMRKYGQWLKTQGFTNSTGINPNEPNLEVLRSEINACEEINFSHTLPKPGEQQYYEVIGKYQNFLTGWSTADPGLINKNNYINYRLSQVDTYMSDRQQANNYFDRGSYALDVVIVNHLLSAADGVLSVQSFNKSLGVKACLNFRSNYNYATQRRVLVPYANLTVDF